MTRSKLNKSRIKLMKKAIPHNLMKESGDSTSTHQPTISDNAGPKLPGDTKTVVE